MGLSKAEFDAMEDIKQVELINSYLAQNKSLSDICEKEKLIDMGRKALRTRFAKINFEYDSKENKYVHKDITEAHNIKGYNPIQKVPLEPKNTEYKTNTNVSSLEHKNIPNVSTQEGTNIPIAEHKSIQKVPTQECINVYKSEELTELLQSTKHMQEQFQEMWSWYNNQKNIIEIAELKIEDSFDDEVVAKTFRVHKNVLNEFLILCDDHKEYKQQTIVSKALLEFIKKYKK